MVHSLQTFKFVVGLTPSPNVPTTDRISQIKRSSSQEQTVCPVPLSGLARQMSAAHVFRCEELATEIFNHLAPGPLRKTDTVQYRLCRRQRQTTLARAACVCRAWSDPALNVLWRVVDDIHNLLSLLPPYSVEEYLTAVSTLLYLLNVPLTRSLHSLLPGVHP